VSVTTETPTDEVLLEFARLAEAVKNHGLRPVQMETLLLDGHEVRVVIGYWKGTPYQFRDMASFMTFRRQMSIPLYLPR
jgi:hypothetical protein